MDFYKHLITLRKTIPALSHLDKKSLCVYGIEEEKILIVKRWKDSDHVFLVFNFNTPDVKITPSLSEGTWNKVLDSSENKWDGHGALLKSERTPGNEIIIRGHSLVMYHMKTNLGD